MAGYDTLTGWGRIDVGRTVLNMAGRYSLLHRQETGATLADSTAKLKAEMHGFTSQGLKHGTMYWFKQFTFEKTVSYPQFAEGDSVFCWGMSYDSSGLRDYVRKWSFYTMGSTTPNHKIFNRNMCYPDHSSIDEDSAVFRSYYYKVYYDVTDSVIAVLGESNPDSVVFSYAVVGPDSMPDKRIDSVVEILDHSGASLNYPNPFNPSTRIDYTVGTHGSEVKIGIYDLRGRLIKHIVNEVMPRGSFTAVWDGRDGDGKIQAAGVYVARVSIGQDFKETRKLVLLK